MKPFRTAAFTLVEMLTVLGVIVVMIAIVAPAAIQTLRGSNLTQSGETIGDEFVLARQTAVTSGRPVEVRFYVLPDPSGAKHFNGVQSYRVEESGRKTALDKLRVLRSNIIISPDSVGQARFSSLIPTDPSQTLNWTATSITGKEYLNAYNRQECDYVGFQYQSDGSTDLDPLNQQAAASGGWLITLVDTSVPQTGGVQPKNFYTWRVDPLTGRARLFRP